MIIFDILEAIVESVSKGISETVMDIATGGTNSEIKKHAHNYELAYKSYSDEQKKNEDLVNGYEVLTRNLYKEKLRTANYCKKIVNNLSQLVVESSFDFIKLENVGISWKVVELKEGITYSSLDKGFAKNKVGESLRYVNFFKPSTPSYSFGPVQKKSWAERNQNQLIIATEIMKMIQSGIETANENLAKIVEEEKKLNEVIKSALEENTKINTCNESINLTLNELKDKRKLLYAINRKIVAFCKKKSILQTSDLHVLNQEERIYLQELGKSLNSCTSVIVELLKKEHSPL